MVYMTQSKKHEKNNEVWGRALVMTSPQVL